MNQTRIAEYEDADGANHQSVSPRLPLFLRPIEGGDELSVQAAALFARIFPAKQLPFTAGDTYAFPMPFTLAAYSEGGLVVGVGSLVSSFIPARGKFVLMLANLGVASCHRGQGVASAIVAELMRLSVMADRGDLYAATNHPSLFWRLGWGCAALPLALPPEHCILRWSPERANGDAAGGGASMSEDSDQEAWLLRVLGVGLKVGRQSRSDNVIQSATTTSSFLESAMLDWESASDAAYSALDEARAEYKRRGGKEHLYAAALIARLQQQLVAPIHGADAAAKLESELKANQALALLDHELGIRAALLKTAGEIVAAYGREGQ